MAEARSHDRTAYLRHVQMGLTSDNKAVVDQRGRVHGMEGIRLVDASAMSDCICANTNVTTMMIGERMADFIINDKV